ncbi:probable disease resistance protein At4g19060 [Solanum stenotomum]|uniref:probable disease resistance protein At4g19060 n=1 Tax=Solanum stenotomum TaxID=172797 RepID=UPI0020D17E1A|nr:probable disease resistance protein At4g19060 [Solanum stenotomum]
MAGETETYLWDKLVLAQKAEQGREDCLSKFPCKIQKHFVNVICLLGQGENGDLSESSRRGDLYHLCNALANCQMVLERKGVYSLGGIRFLITLNSKLKKMESRLKGTTSGGVTRQEGDIDDEKIIMNECHDRWSCRTVDRNRVFGFREKENFMERFLIRRDNEFKAICISGVAGVGKTTLCQLTFNNEQVMKNFFPRIWVCMSKSPEVTDDDYKKEVLKRMLKCIGVEDQVIDFKDDEGRDHVVGLLFALRNVLKGTRYLIVLDDTFYINFFDDLWSEPELLKVYDDTQTLALGLPKQHGGAVIVTTRSNEELGKKMVNKDNVYPLLPLTNKSCLEILKDSAGEKVKQLLKDQTDDDLEDTIMSKLGGLPLAAKIMGTIMKQQLDKIPEN